MTLDNPSAVLSTVLHASIAWVGTTLFCVVAEQPAWLPILCAVIASLPSGYRILRDRRLADAQKTNADLVRENAILRKRLEVTPVTNPDIHKLWFAAGILVGSVIANGVRWWVG